MKKKWYAVHAGRGRTPEIHPDWETCRAATDGYPGAVYRGFPSQSDALSYLAALAGLSPEALVGKYPHLGEGLPPGLPERAPRLLYHRTPPADVDLYVDGSFREGIPAYGYGVVLVRDNELLEERSGYGNKADALALRNVSGEMLGTIEGLRSVQRHGFSRVALHFDYQGIESWAIGAWKRNNRFTRAYHACLQKFMKTLEIRFVKVRAHSGDPWNERADALARQGVEEYRADAES